MREFGNAARVSVPEIVTKELAVANVGGRRRVRVSSNFLPLMGFTPGGRHSVDVIDGCNGLRLKFATDGAIKVYERRYGRRKSNPFEAVVEVANQDLLARAIPSYTERVHLTMRHGEILVTPLANRTFGIRKSLKGLSELAAMVAMTAGVDVRCLQECGFKIDSILEYRPREARDVVDLTESGVLTVLANSSPRLVINEDISTVDWSRIAAVMDGGPPIAVLHVSLQCDDFSKAKGRALKERSDTDLTTSRDLVYDALRMVETIRPASIVVENVPAFEQSGEGRLLSVKLRKWGYHVAEGVLRADEFGGLTRRERYYLVASVWPGYNLPTPTGRNAKGAWAEIEPLLGGCRDVTETKSVAAGLDTGRIRVIRKGTMVAPTLLKSQNRQAKDSVYIQTEDGRLLMPSLEALVRLQGIAEDFSFTCTSEAVASEVIGQGIEVPMHRAVVKGLHEHIASNVGGHMVVNLSSEGSRNG